MAAVSSSLTGAVLQKRGALTWLSDPFLSGTAAVRDFVPQKQLCGWISGLSPTVAG